MSQPAGTEPTTQGTEPVNTDPGTGSTAPEGTPPVVTEPEAQAPYSAYLEEFPESLRGVAESVFKKWDADVTKKFQEVHSEYEPWKQITEAADPDSVAMALALAKFLEDNPQELYQRIGQTYGFAQPQQGQPGQQQPPVPTGEPAGSEEEADPNTQKLSQLEQAVIALATAMQGQQQQTEQERNGQLLEQTLTGLQEKHGEYDQNYVLAMIAQGIDPEAAITQWKQSVEQYATKLNAPPAPPVVSSSGGIPSTQVDVSTLDDKSTKDLVASMLKQAAEASS